MRIAFAILLSALSLAAADEAPPWLRQAAAITPPKYDAKVKSVVLLDDERVSVEEGGKITTSHTYAVRILTREGRDEASAHVVYVTSGGKVKELRGWMIRPSGDVKKYGKDSVADVALSRDDLYNEARAQVIMASDDADPGAVFGYESVVEEKSVFTQFEWEFQTIAPTLTSRFSINVPPGWRADGILYNHAKLDPVAGGGGYTWELRDLPPVEREPSRPHLSSIVPWLAVSVVPAGGARTGLGKMFDNWQDVARWHSEMADPQMTVNEDLTAKVHALIKDAQTDFERIQAIGRYVQGVKYIAIQTGLGRGGGYKPHSAVDVFTKSYGDCKDKANLMRTMLKVAGIEAYPVAIWSGDPAHVREDWASPQQFNHQIVAVRVKGDVKAASVGSHPALGPMLFFDPTDAFTPVGLLPEYEENSLALLVSADHGALLRMPTSPPEANRMERSLDLTLATDGSLTGKVETKAYGHSGADYRAEYKERAKADFRKHREEWIAQAGSGTVMNSLDVEETPNAGMRFMVAFATPRYAKLMQGVLLVVKPQVLPALGEVTLAETKRKYPVVLESAAYEETVHMKLPDGFEVDELPHARKAATDFASYVSTYEVKDGYLTFHRAFSMKAVTIPVEKYKEARDFFSLVNGADAQPLVLAKK